MNNYEYLLSDISILKGVGKSLVSKFKRKNIHTIFDLILSIPSKYIDRSIETQIKDLHVGKIQTLTVMIERYNFPRIRNLPNRVVCEDEHSKIDIVFFNSREGYIRKVLPLNSNVVISGKVQTYKGKFQITNPEYISKIDDGYPKKITWNPYNNKNPIINSFKINKIYPNTLKINFEKTNPVASIFINGDIFYIGENEKIFKDAQYETEVPIIKGFVDLNEINKFLRILKESQLNSMGIEYLVYHQSKRWDIFFKNDINLKLPINVDQNTINNASRLLKDENFKKKIIDLRIKNKIIVTNE